jgi:hypothetical protein
LLFNPEQTTLVPAVVRSVGLGSFNVRGITINALAQPYRFYLLKRVQDEYATLDESAQKDVAELLTACDMSTATATTPTGDALVKATQLVLGGYPSFSCPIKSILPSGAPSMRNMS